MSSFDIPSVKPDNLEQLNIFKKLFQKQEIPHHQSLTRLHIPVTSEDATMEAYFLVRENFKSIAMTLERAITEAGVGEFDGDEYGGGEYTLWFYGANPEAMAEVIRGKAPFLGLPEGSSLYLATRDSNGDEIKSVVEEL